MHIKTFQISFGVIFYTLGRLLNNWSVLRMRLPLRREDKNPHMLLVLGSWSLVTIKTRLKHNYAPSALKQKHMRIFIFPPGAEGHIHNTNRLLLLSNAETMSSHIKMTLKAYKDDHSFVYVFMPVRALIAPILF